MPHRVKILILEHDDFLREILGNLLHKKGFYIINGATIKRGIQHADKHHIDRIIIGSSCKDFKGRSSINYLHKLYGNPHFMLINNGDKAVSYLPKDQQILTKHLSIQKIIDTITS